MTIIKKSMTLLLVLLLLCGCTTSSNNEQTPSSRPTSVNNQYNLLEDKENLTGKDCIDYLKNFTVRKKNQSNTTDNKEFEDFMNECFVEALESDYLNMHYTVVDYKSFGIEKPDLTLGEIKYEEPDVSDLIEELTALHNYEYDSLSYRQQYDFEIYEYSLIESIASVYYEKYGPLFNGKTDLLSTIVTNFDEFVFYDKETVDDYLVLLKDIDRYLEDALAYTEKQAENGVYLIDFSIDYVQDYVASFISKVEDNSLITSFNNRIDKVDFISNAEKETYKKQNAEVIINEVIPVFAKAADVLETYRGKVDSFDMTLKKVNEEYAELNYMLETSNNISPNEIFENAKDMFDDYLALRNTAIYNEDALYEYSYAYYGLIEPFGCSHEELLKYLSENYTKKFPDIGEIEYTVSYLEESSASDSVIAYFVSPPLDNLDANVIRVNPNNASEDMTSDFFTLAHEGIPGHMYQNAYQVIKGLSMNRYLQTFLGYSEGYACYSQNEALDFVGLSEDAYNLAVVEWFGGYILESIIDIGVNYMDWTMEDVANYLDENGYRKEAAELLYNDSVDRPGTLTSYGIGYLNFMTLKNYAEEQLRNNFNIVEFNDAILKNGTMPFNILKGAVDEYIEQNK